MKKQIKRIFLSLSAGLLCIGLGGCSLFQGGTSQSSSGSSGLSDKVEETKVDPYAYEGHATDPMPCVSIVTDDRDSSFATVPSRENKWDYVNCTVTLTDEDGAETSAKAGIKVRGNYTANYSKKPFRIKFDKKQGMLGLNDGAKCKSWVLLADYKDASMLRNVAAFYYGQTLLGSDGYYSSDFRNVEVYINGQYWGVYLLAEQQQINPNRVNINEAADRYAGTDIGYFLEYDGYYDQEEELQRFTVNYNNGASLQTYDGWDTTPNQYGFTIKNDIYSKEQHDFISSYTENVYRICYYAAYDDAAYVFNDDYTGIYQATDIAPQEAVEQAIDVDSLVDMYLLQEIACDSDINWSSFFMDVDMSVNGDKRLVFEAPWDFDSAFGNCSACETGVGMYAANSQNPWLLVLIGQDWFRDKVKAKWQDAEKWGVFSRSLEFLENYFSVNASYYEENYGKWSNICAGDIIGELCSASAACKTQEQAKDYLLSWLGVRLDYLNSVWGSGEAIDKKNKVPDLSDRTAFRFQAEDAALTGGILVRSGNNASGNAYLGNVAGGADRTITFTVYAAEDTEAYLYVGLSRRSYAFLFSSFFSVYVNDKKLAIPARFVEAGDDSWHDWTSVAITSVPLQAGENKITLRTLSTDCTNIDYIDLYSRIVLHE